MACILLWSSAVRVHDSRAYRKMDVARELISHVLDLREILLSFQTGFNLSMLLLPVLPWRGIRLGTLISYNWAQVLEACDCLKLLTIYFDLCVDATDGICQQLGLLGTFSVTFLKWFLSWSFVGWGIRLGLRPGMGRGSDGCIYFNFAQCGVTWWGVTVLVCLSVCLSVCACLHACMYACMQCVHTTITSTSIIVQHLHNFRADLSTRI